MLIVSPNQEFSFTYQAYDQVSSLFVKFTLYDVSSGVPVLLTTVTATYASLGAYIGGYTAISGKTYLVIGLVYTDNTYTSIDTNRSPMCGVWQSADAGPNFFGFAYGAYDQAAGLFPRATIYDVSTGSPVFSSFVIPVYAIAGIYFGSMDGVLGKTYQAITAVYTDNGYTTSDLNRSPGVDSFDCFVGSGGGGGVFIQRAVLTGHNL